MNRDSQKVALITGSSRGLGLALARSLARSGWALIVNGRHLGPVEAVRDELSLQTKVLAVVGDVADAEVREQLRDAARKLGGLDALVNNASSLGPSPMPFLLDYPLAELRRVFEINTLAPLGLIQALRGLLRPGARILDITSDAGVEAYPGWGGYGSSKAALEQLSAVLAAEQPEFHIYSVDPGDMRTQMHQDAFPGEDLSDRPLPETSVPGLLELINGDLPSGRYAARDLCPVVIE